MKTYDLQEFLSEEVRKLLHNGQSIGFVPTMGALHKGHLSLIEQSKKENSCTICSIFVNPTQFDNQKDLQTYPTDLEKDMQLLIENRCDILFTPSRNEMYPEGERAKIFNFDGLDISMEGAHREGHFNGVATIILKLLDIVKPSKIYLGQKDYQQFKIICKIIKDYNIPTIPVLCPIIREQDGLALSSRNVKLHPHARQEANILYRSLLEFKGGFGKEDFKLLKLKASENIGKASSVTNLDYFDVVDADTLIPLSDWSTNRKMIACVAARFGDVRLIDNMMLN